MIDYKKFVEKSVDYLADYIVINKLQSLILGISGGIDSTVTAAIASKACEKVNASLIGRSLPTETNSPDEKNVANLVGKAFCDNYKEVAIGESYRKFHQLISESENIFPNNLQDGNIKARLRMMYLYNLASMYKGCVLDTDNRTEHELGFWTIHGDVGDLNCGIIHLWKTEVYDLAEYILTSYEILAIRTEQISLAIQALKQSIDLIPTDGNGVMSGGDCAQFGLDNYEQVDDVLKTMYFSNIINEDIRAKEYIRLIDSYNEQGVDKVMILHQNTEFKRKHLPIYPLKELLIYEMSKM